jgi:hypothetical protein
MAALARVVLPNSHAVVLEQSVGALILGTTAPTVTAALLARVTIPDHTLPERSVALLLGASVRFARRTALAIVVLPHRNAVALEQSVSALILGTTATIVTAALLARVTIPRHTLPERSVALLLGASVHFARRTALAIVVLPHRNAIALEQSVGAHLLGTTVTIVTAALLARAVLPGHSHAVALLLVAVVLFVLVAALARAILPDSHAVALEQSVSALFFGAVVSGPTAALASSRASH